MNASLFIPRADLLPFITPLVPHKRRLFSPRGSKARCARSQLLRYEAANAKIYIYMYVQRNDDSCNSHVRASLFQIYSMRKLTYRALLSVFSSFTCRCTQPRCLRHRVYILVHRILSVELSTKWRFFSPSFFSIILILFIYTEFDCCFTLFCNTIFTFLSQQKIF